MASLIDSLIQFVTGHHHLAYMAVFLFALLESVPVVGTFVPGSGIIVAISAFVAAGDLGLAPTLGAAIAGGVIGDGSAFFIGRAYKDRILTLWPLSKYPAIVSRSETFFERYGLLAILIARFIPPIRAFIPVIAGTLGMTAGRFLPVNIFAVILWACAHVLPGALAGSLWKSHAKQIEHIAAPAMAVLAVSALLVWLVRRRRELL